MTSIGESELPFGLTPLRALVLHLSRATHTIGDVDAVAGNLGALGMDPKASSSVAIDGVRWMAEVVDEVEDSPELLDHFFGLGFALLAALPPEWRAHIRSVLGAIADRVPEPEICKQMIAALEDRQSQARSSRSAELTAEDLVSVAGSLESTGLSTMLRRLEADDLSGNFTVGGPSAGSIQLPPTRQDPGTGRQGGAKSRDAWLRQALQDAVGGDYEVLKKLGEGGFGVVFEAKQVAVDRLAAIKGIVRRGWGDAEDDFLKEVQIIGRLAHPNIIPIWQVGAGPAMYWFSMPLVKGGSLEKSVASGRSNWSFDDAAFILGQVARALDYAHGKKVIHRDIKLPNLMVNEDGQVFVADFGVAKVVSEGQATMTNALGPTGTLYAIAPELWAGHSATPASDLYAFGVAAFQLLTARLPLQGRSHQEWMAQHVEGSPSLLRQLRPDLPVAAERAIARALAKNPRERFGSCTEFVASMAEAPAPATQPDTAKPRAAATVEERGPAPAPLRAEQTGIPPIPAWWLQHLTELSDYTVEKGTSPSSNTRTGRHQRLWQEATQWLDQVTKAVLDRPGERWSNHPSQYQQGKLNGTYWGRLYPDSHPELEDVFHIGIQVSKKLKWVKKTDPMYLDLVRRAAGPVITVWASTNDKLIERLARPELHELDGALQHQIVLHRPELWHEGGALIRAQGTLMNPLAYLEAVERGDLPPQCSIFGPLFTAEEVEKAPEETARRIAGFLTLLADPVRQSRKVAAQTIPS